MQLSRTLYHGAPAKVNRKTVDTATAGAVKYFTSGGLAAEGVVTVDARRAAGGVAVEPVAFEYECHECGKGKVAARLIPEYHTRVKGYPFVVKGAWIWVCDSCGAEHFSVQERERWERMFEAEHAQHYMAPEEVQALRKSLGLTMEQFALLLGCTRQSVHHWERHDRGRSPLRMADLLMRLVYKSLEDTAVDVIGFLAHEAERFGAHVDMGRPGPNVPRPIVLHASGAREPATEGTAPADGHGGDDGRDGHDKGSVELTRDGQTVGRLAHDSTSAALELRLTKPLGHSHFDVTVAFTDGTRVESKDVRVRDRRPTLLRGTGRPEREVSRVILQPAGDAAERIGGS